MTENEGKSMLKVEFELPVGFELIEPIRTVDFRFEGPLIEVDSISKRVQEKIIVIFTF